MSMRVSYQQGWVQGPGAGAGAGPHALAPPPRIRAMQVATSSTTPLTREPASWDVTARSTEEVVGRSLPYEIARKTNGKWAGIRTSSDP
jgi:hypothetical protein